MFDSLKQIAKLEGEGEDKGQLNYHVILIGMVVRQYSITLPDKVFEQRTCNTSFLKSPKWTSLH